MSRTRKDTPHKVRFPDSTYFDSPRGFLTKKKKTALPNWECMYHSTPGWFIHLYMTKRRRRENRIYESIIKYVPIEMLDEYEPFLNWKRPHEYYW